MVIPESTDNDLYKMKRTKASISEESNEGEIAENTQNDFTDISHKCKRKYYRKSNICYEKIQI